MTNAALVPEDLTGLYEFHEWRNALAVLSAACMDLPPIERVKAKRGRYSNTSV